ncbi:MAG: alpha/beta fold hydrolase [Acidimicrobiia bacterium]
MTTEHLTHNRVRLALHTLRAGGEGRPLLLLHGLGERTPDVAPPWTASWPGPVHGLDFTGHGASTMPVGGGYSSETLMADADAAVHRLGSCTIVGRGVGAYAALLIAGGRPEQIVGAVLCDGPGLVGGGTGPVGGSSTLLRRRSVLSPPDPYALHELSHDVRPADYAMTFVHLATSRSSLPMPIAVCAIFRPPWLAAVADHPAVLDTSLGAALATFAERGPSPTGR